MIIYQLPISLYSFKVRLAIALKGATVAYQAPPGGSYRAPDYHAINPAGTIPALVDGDFVVAESDAIVEYLDDRHVGRPLMPSDPALRARTRMLSRWCDMRLEAPVRSLFPQVRPAPHDAELIAHADARIAAALALFEETLDGEGPFSLGAPPGLADCGLTATMVWLEAMTVPLSLSARVGAKLTRVIDAMRRHAAVAAEIESYDKLVRDWVASKTG